MCEREEFMFIVGRDIAYIRRAVVNEVGCHDGQHKKRKFRITARLVCLGLMFTIIIISILFNHHRTTPRRRYLHQLWSVTYPFLI